MNNSKICIECGVIKSFNDFHKRSSMLDGYYNTCKICRKMESKNYYLSNRESIRDKANKYNSEHKEKKATMDRNYYINNSVQLLEKNREYRKRNRSAIKIQRRGYYINNTDKISSYKKKFYNTPHGKSLSVMGHRRYKAKKKAQLHPLNNSKIEYQLELIRQRVENCLGISHHLDHVWPISKGGLHHIENLRIIPSSLNLRKNNDMTFEHPSITMWYDLPNWLIEETLTWKKTPFYIDPTHH